MDVNLLPCPFCGGENPAVVSVSNTNANVKYVACTKCQAHGPWGYGYEMRSARDQAIDQWNKREGQQP